MSLKYAFWQYLKRFGTAENILKTMSLKHAHDGIWNNLELQRKDENNVSKESILTVFEKIGTCKEKIENNVSKACILTVFEIIWNCR